MPGPTSRVQSQAPPRRNLPSVPRRVLPNVTLVGPEEPVVPAPDVGNPYRYLLDEQGTAPLNIKATLHKARKIVDVVKDEAPPHGGAAIDEVP